MRKRRKTLYYIELYGGRCGVDIGPKSDILRKEGTGNVKLLRKATREDVGWIRSMGGRIPEGKGSVYVAPE